MCRKGGTDVMKAVIRRIALEGCRSEIASDNAEDFKQGAKIARAIEVSSEGDRF